MKIIDAHAHIGYIGGWADVGITGEELIAKAYKDSELSGREYERVVDYVQSVLKDNKKSG